MTERPDLRDQILGNGRTTGRVRETADVVIIGSGCGGAVAAKELAEKGLSVVVLEEGGYFDHRDFNQNACEMFINLYRDAGSTITLGNPPIALPLGKLVGGTAVINSGTCFRTPDWVLRKWALAYGVEGCTPEEIRPYFERVEQICHVSTLTEDVLGTNAKIVRRGAERLGLTLKPLAHNHQGCRGCGTCAIGCPDGAKEAPNVNYIPMAMAGGAKVYARARAEKIRTKKGRAAGVSGVLFDDRGKQKIGTIEVDAPIVIVSAGTIHTAALLQKNHLANGSGELGRNLTIHPASRVTALFDERIEGWRGVPQGSYIDDLSPDGIMFEGIFVPPALSAPLIPECGLAHKELLAQYPNLAAYGAMVMDTSKGTVRHTGMKPHIFYRMNDLDTQRLLRAIAIMARVFFAAGARRVVTAVAGATDIAESEIPSIERRKLNPADIEIMAFHPLGTCRMGPDPQSSVVTPELETHQVKGLFAIDGSVFPSSLGVNPQITIMAFATKAAMNIGDHADRWV